ncbi:endonuclease/exonuclease/phosphatase family protein [Mycoplasmatota bacterium WC44]
MKICTYNIWNDKTNFDIRLELLVNEINRYELDFIALQEVKDERTFNYIQSKTNFKNGYFYEGLGFLSNHEIIIDKTFNENNSFVQRIIFDNIALTNVHLDWKNEENRIIGIDKVIDYIEENQQEYEFILGDFNDTPDDSIHYELRMDDFQDLYQTYCHKRNVFPKPTLDFENNPRWRNQKVDEVSVRFDWVLLHTKNNFEVKNAYIIGTDETNGIAPSDHYGVVVDVD